MGRMPNTSAVPMAVAAAIACVVVAAGMLIGAGASAGASDRASDTAAASHAAAAAAAAAVGTPVDAASPIVSAGVDDFTFESMNADYTLTRADDGTSKLRVVETFVAVFPDSDQNRGLRRVIPDTYKGQPLRPRLESITDENGAAHASETDAGDGQYRMTSRSDAFVRGAQTYVFTYTLQNVTWTFADTGADEFFWDVNGVDWPQPFQRVTATVRVDAPLADALTNRQACYRGAQRSAERCDITADTEGGATIVRAAADDLSARQTMSIAVGFREGTFARFDSSYFASPLAWAQAVSGLGALGVLIVVLLHRRRRTPAGRALIIPQFTPPDRIDALQSAVLLGKTSKAIPAEVLEQAVVGSIRIVEGKPKLWGGRKLQAELIDRSRADGDGRMLLRGLFGGAPPGAVFEFGRSDTRFSMAAQKVLAWAGKELERNGVRRKVDWPMRAIPMALVFVAAALAVILGILAAQSGVNSWLLQIVVFVSLAVAVMVVALLANKPLTARGAETRAHLLGLKMFIKWAEADRIRMLQSPSGAQRVTVDAGDPRQMLRLYETLLPYAVVFGQEKKWAKHITVLYGETTPSWYVGVHGFNASSFASGIGSLSVSSVSSSSSSSGGSGGGGYAGGGGGGGGGGGV